MSESDSGTVCAHCPDGHSDPTTRPWGVYVASEVDGDGQPVRLCVMPSDGAHVAESDAQWLREWLNASATVERQAGVARGRLVDLVSAGERHVAFVESWLGSGGLERAQAAAPCGPLLDLLREFVTTARDALLWEWADPTRRPADQ